MVQVLHDFHDAWFNQAEPPRYLPYKRAEDPVCAPYKKTQELNKYYKVSLDFYEKEKKRKKESKFRATKKYFYTALLDYALHNSIKTKLII